MASGSSGVKKDDFASYGANANASNDALNSINPIYQQMLTGNDGLTPQQKSNALTASEQSVGGSTAGAVGEGNLMAARNGNVGGYQVGADDAARNGQVVNSSNALGVQNMSDQIARQNQQSALSGLNSIYQSSDAQGNDALKNAAAAPPSFWQQLGSQAAFGTLKALQTGGLAG